MRIQMNYRADQTTGHAPTPSCRGPSLGEAGACKSACSPRDLLCSAIQRSSSGARPFCKMLAAQSRFRPPFQHCAIPGHPWTFNSSQIRRLQSVPVCIIPGETSYTTTVSGDLATRWTSWLPVLPLRNTFIKFYSRTTLRPGFVARNAPLRLALA